MLKCNNKGGHWRNLLVRYFRNLKGSHVVMHKRKYFSSSSYESTVREYLLTILHYRKSTFCLIPPGLTASSRRLYESVQSGCIPVLVSDHFLLPFYDGEVRVLWDNAVVRHSQSNMSTLPGLLYSMPKWQIRKLKRAGQRLKKDIAYVEGQTLLRIHNAINQLLY